MKNKKKKIKALADFVGDLMSKVDLVAQLPGSLELLKETADQSRIDKSRYASISIIVGYDQKKDHELSMFMDTAQKLYELVEIRQAHIERYKKRLGGEKAREKIKKELGL